MSRMSQADIPEGAFRQHMRVRSYEVGQDGRLRAGNLLRYLESVATEASASVGFTANWYQRQGTAWVVREMDIYFGALPGVATALEVATWVADFKRVQALREYAIWSADTGALVARAHARWAYIDRVRGIPVRLPEELSSVFQPGGHAMRIRDQVPASAPSDLPTEMRLMAREYEADSQLHINNCAYADWLGEAMYQAVASSRAGLRVSPRCLRIEYARPALPGTFIRIETCLAPARSRRVRADQAVYDGETGQVYVRATSEYLASVR